MKWADGRIYEGEYADDYRTKGKLTYPNGKVEEGRFDEDGKFVGK